MSTLDKRSLALIGVLMLGVIAGVEPVKALESPRVYRGYLLLEGKIEPGDYFSVRNFLRDKSNFDKISGGVFLASPGGYVGEAMKIGHLIRALQLRTAAPSNPSTSRAQLGEPAITPRDLVDPRRNYLCASSCFFVYVAGIHRNLTRVGRLGFHRPTRKQSNLTPVGPDMAKVIDRNIRETVKRYLDEMDVPSKYLTLMFNTPPNEMYWLTQDEFDTDFRGYIPMIKEQIYAHCDVQHAKGKSLDDDNCSVEHEQRNDAWRKIFISQ